MECFNGNHTKHFPIKLSAASHLAAHPAFNSNALFLWELYANWVSSPKDNEQLKRPLHPHSCCVLQCMEMPISHPGWLRPPQMWEAVTLWPGLYSPLQSSLCALRKLSLIPWHMLEILRLSSWWRFCLNEALQQITQDLARQREKENASLIWNPTVRERSNPLLLQSQQLTLKNSPTEQQNETYKRSSMIHTFLSIQPIHGHADTHGHSLLGIEPGQCLKEKAFLLLFNSLILQV